MGFGDSPHSSSVARPSVSAASFDEEGLLRALLCCDALGVSEQNASFSKCGELRIFKFDLLRFIANHPNAAVAFIQQPLLSGSVFSGLLTRYLQQRQSQRGIERSYVVLARLSLAVPAVAPFVCLDLPHARHIGRIVALRAVVGAVEQPMSIPMDPLAICRKCATEIPLSTSFPDYLCISRNTLKLFTCQLCGGRFRDVTGPKAGAQMIQLTTPGEYPSLRCLIWGDDVNSTRLGASVQVVGILRVDNQGLVLDTHSIRVCEPIIHESLSASFGAMESHFVAFWQRYSTRPLSGRNVFLNSLAPHLVGDGVLSARLALLLALSDPPFHILLLGPTGCGKTELLRAVAHLLHPHSAFIVGHGISPGEMLLDASRQKGQWRVQGGVSLVAGPGAVCIDELSLMPSETQRRTAELLSGVITVSKPGFVVSAEPCASVFGAASTDSKPLVSELSSRFCLSVVIAPPTNPALLAEAVCDSVGSEFANAVVGSEALGEYLGFCRTIVPQPTHRASELLTSVIQHAVANGVPQGELYVLPRLCKAHARLLCHPQVQVLDVVQGSWAFLLLRKATEAERPLFKQERQLLCLDSNADSLSSASEDALRLLISS